MQSLIPFLIIFYLVLLGIELTIPDHWENFVKFCLKLKYVRAVGLLPLSLSLTVLYSVYKYSFKFTWLLLILSFIYFCFGTTLLINPKVIISFYEDYYFKRTDEEKKRMLKSDIIIMTTILSLLFIALL
ncbi:MAG: hypothetical protein PHX78_00240 [bacterium]|nr:hypothetical protein [bacterium]